jgi:exopolysaccharide biosynthesis polyprenyl glycosylphosphotransferase
MAAITLGLLFWLKLPDVSRLYLVVLFPIQFGVALATRAALRVVFRSLRSRGLNRRFVLMIGAGPRGQAFARTLSAHRDLGLEIVGFLDDDPPAPLPPPWKHLGKLEDIEAVLRERVIDEVVICLPFSQWSMVDAISQIAEDDGKIVRVPIDVIDRAFSTGKVEDLDGVPVFSLVSGPDRLVSLALKRLVDILGATVGLIVLSPVLAAIALAIVIREGPPVLFRQVRVGLHGRPFQVLKFRTMVADAEARYQDVVGLSDPRAFKVTNDPRITKLGAFLRRTSLDELPQLWNVLRGEMSLVGPRPAPPREVGGYDLWHRRRLSMKPGITGLWQVTARSDEDFDNRAQLDLAYIDRWSLMLDVKIILRTIPAAFSGR